MAVICGVSRKSPVAKDGSLRLGSKIENKIVRLRMDQNPSEKPMALFFIVAFSSLLLCICNNQFGLQVLDLMLEIFVFSPWGKSRQVGVIVMGSLGLG